MFRLKTEVNDGNFSAMAVAAPARDVPGTKPGLITDLAK